MTRHGLAKCATFDDTYLSFVLKAPPTGISVPAGAYYLTKQGLDGHRYRLGHPLAQHILDEASQRKLTSAHVTFDYLAWKQKAISLEAFVGASGVLAVRKLSVSGADAQDHILFAAVADDGRAIEPAAAQRLFDLPVRKSRMAWLPLPSPFSKAWKTNRWRSSKLWSIVSPHGSTKRSQSLTRGPRTNAPA